MIIKIIIAVILIVLLVGMYTIYFKLNEEPDEFKEHLKLIADFLERYPEYEKNAVYIAGVPVAIKMSPTPYSQLSECEKWFVTPKGYSTEEMFNDLEYNNPCRK